ncbi:hypothetical protein ACYILN_14665 [Enterococcus faecium]
MPIAIGNKRLPVTLDEKRQKELQQLKQKYGKSESKIMCIALDLLIAQEKAGFDVPALKKVTSLFNLIYISDITFTKEGIKC